MGRDDSTASFILTLFVGLLAIIFLVLAANFGIFGKMQSNSDNQQAERDSEVIQNVKDKYIDIKAKPYTTIDDVKGLVHKVNDAQSEDADDVLEKLDNKIVVDNRDGHEYICTINIDSDEDSYNLTPRIKDKSAVINKNWQRMHSKKE